MIRSTAHIAKKAPIPSPIDLGHVIREHNSLLRTVEEKKQALIDLHAETERTHEDFVSKVKSQLVYLDSLIANVAASMKKGDKGDTPIAGVDYPIPQDGISVDHKKVVSDVLAQIEKPKDTPTVDYRKIAKMAAAMVPKVDEKTMAERILEVFATGKKKLSIKHIGDFSEGLEQTLAPIRHLAAGFRGGGDTVAAGSGVSISSSGGVKTITATGGFTTLTPTETPNSSLTVFTFAAATAKPTFIVADNVIMSPTTKSGTINWTWNVGLKQATMTIAPQDDILGIV